MHTKVNIDTQEWKTVYEDSKRKILACGDERRAVDASTGKIITEYRVVTATAT